MLTIQAYDDLAAKAFLKRHRVNVNNGHVASRYVWLEILARKDGAWPRFHDVCPFQCLGLAKQLHEEGWEVTGIYAYYYPVRGYNTYEEASCWLTGREIRGLTDGVASLRHHCNCR